MNVDVAGDVPPLGRSLGAATAVGPDQHPGTGAEGV